MPTPSDVPCAPPSPLAEGTFRVQRPRPRPGPLAPNLTVTLISSERQDVVNCNQVVEVWIRVGNGGGARSAPTDLAWHAGDPAAGGVLLAELLRSDNQTAVLAKPVLTRILGAKFKREVHPGDTIAISVRMKERVGEAWFLKGTVRVDGKVAVQVEFGCILKK